MAKNQNNGEKFLKSDANNISYPEYGDREHVQERNNAKKSAKNTYHTEW